MFLFLRYVFMLVCPIFWSASLIKEADHTPPLQHLCYVFLLTCQKLCSASVMRDTDHTPPLQHLDGYDFSHDVARFILPAQIRAQPMFGVAASDLIAGPLLRERPELPVERVRMPSTASADTTDTTSSLPSMFRVRTLWRTRCRGGR